MTSKKHLWKLPVLVASLAMGLGVFTVIKASPKNAEPAFATYTNGDAATYYNSIDSTQSGNTLLTALRTLNLSKRKSTVGYDSMGTTPSGQFKYTDYDPNYVQYDSNDQPYGTKISSFYTYTSATSWNREHVWPNSHGGGSKGDAGSPYVDQDIHMPRPTISSENSSRGNSFFVEGMNHSSNGWDPYTAGYSAESRGEAARITFYCTLVNSKLILAPNNTTPSGTDSVTGQSYGSGHTMGNLETLLKWNINYAVTQREKNRNEGAEYLQGNRNAFVDHPEYACKIWGNVNSTTKSLCANASWDTGPSVNISRSTASIVVDDTTMISATSSDSSTISWTSSDTTVVTVSSATSSSGTNITLTGVGPGTATVTARATINSTTYSATCTVTVSSSGSGGDDPVSTDGVTINVSDIPSAYATTSFTASGYSFGCSNIGNSYSSGNMQWKSGQGYMYNTTPITGISSITIAAPTTGSFSGTIYVGSSSHPTSGTSYSITGGSTVSISGSPSYFTIQAGTVSGGAKCGGITIGQTATKTLSSISVATAPTKTTYTAGEYFDPTGLVITRTYSDSTSDTYTYSGHNSDFTFTPTTSTALTTGNTSVSITYGGKTCNQSITVNAAKTLSSISVSTAPTKTTYTAGEYFDPTGLVITRNYSDSTSDTYTYSGHTSEFTFSPSTSTALTTSNVSVTITYGGKSTSQAITVNAAQKTLSSISISGYTTSFSVDDTFSFGGTVTANFSDSTSSNVTASATFSGYDMSTPGNQTVTVSYTYEGTTKTQTYQITVTTSGGGSSSDPEEYSGQFNYSNMGSTTGKIWTLTNYEDASNYYKCPNSNSTTSVALMPGIFADKTITSDVTIIINSATFGSGTNPSTDTFKIYNGGSVTTQISATKTGTLPTSSTYTDVTYTVSSTNAQQFVDDLAILITKPGKQIRLKSISVSFEYTTTGGTDPVTSITASASKTFYVGETITSSDIVVKDNNNKTITSFSFVNNNYQFVYSDAPSGGAIVSKTFTNAISYDTLTCSLTVSVARKPYASPTGTTSLTHTGAEFSSAGIGSSYTNGQTATVDGVTFTVDGYIYRSKLSLSSSKTSAPGKLVNTTPYPSGITNVTVNGASPDIQLSADGTNWVDLSSATTSTTNYRYLKLFYKTTSQSNYVNITDITVTMKAGESPLNVANYIMYEDTNNQCLSKLDSAIDYLNNLSSSDRTTFQTSDDYVIATARERLEAWAKHEGKTLSFGANEITLTSSPVLSIIKNSTSNVTILIVLLVGAISVGAISSYIYIRHKRREI